ncbi:MAG: BtpA/SgcQ family protein [Petrotogales bacterium]
MINEKEIYNFFNKQKPVIGMLHLKPLPGSPVYDNEGLKPIIKHVLNEARKLVEGGVDALEIENYNDPSYFPDCAPAETTAAMAIIANEVNKAYPRVTLGVCVLADPISSIAVAHSSGAKFIRATFFTEASVDVSGLALRRPHKILRYRKFLDPSIKIFADVHIKHSAPLATRPIEESAYDAAYFLADAVILSGKHTGYETPLENVKKVRKLLPEFPIFIGSGTNKNNVSELLKYASGAIVGTSFKKNGKTEDDIEEYKVKDFMKNIERIRNK